MVPIIGLALVITGVVLLFVSFRLRLRRRTQPQPQPQLRLLRNVEPPPALSPRSHTASARTPLRLVGGIKS